MAQVKASRDGLKVTTGECRVSFPNLFTPVGTPENPDRKQYSVMLLIPKSDTATIKANPNAMP